jgi:hypothetical protein
MPKSRLSWNISAITNHSRLNGAASREGQRNSNDSHLNKRETWSRPSGRLFALQQHNIFKERGIEMPETQPKQTGVDRAKELTDRLEAGMKDLFQSDKYKDYLDTMSHFHHYSSRNIMLINMQYPGATRVASYNLWKEKFNRQVKKGETGIRIFAPMKGKEPETKLMEKLDPETGAPLLDENGKAMLEEMTALTNGVKFKLVPVFDVRQTYGDPLPELIEDLTGNVGHYAAFMDALKEVSPLQIEFEPM